MAVTLRLLVARLLAGAAMNAERLALQLAHAAPDENQLLDLLDTFDLPDIYNDYQLRVRIEQ